MEQKLVQILTQERIAEALREDSEILRQHRGKEVIIEANIAPKLFGGVLERAGYSFCHLTGCKEYDREEEIRKIISTGYCPWDEYSSMETLFDSNSIPNQTIATPQIQRITPFEEIIPIAEEAEKRYNEQRRKGDEEARDKIIKELQGTGGDMENFAYWKFNMSYIRVKKLIEEYGINPEDYK